jgi:hypothetical protein
VAIQGTTEIIGAESAGPEKPSGFGDGLVYACEFDGTAWNILQQIVPQFSSGVDSQAFGCVLSLDGDILIVSGPQGTVNGRGNTGLSHVYRRVGGVWTRPDAPLPNSSPPAREGQAPTMLTNSEGGPT